MLYHESQFTVEHIFLATFTDEKIQWNCFSSFQQISRDLISSEAAQSECGGPPVHSQFKLVFPFTCYLSLSLKQPMFTRKLMNSNSLYTHILHLYKCYSFLELNRWCCLNMIQFNCCHLFLS